MAKAKTSSGKQSAESKLTAAHFIADLFAQQKKAPSDNARFFKGDDASNKIVGIRYGSIFNLAKAYARLPFDEIVKLLENEYYEVRMGAVSIMDFQVRDKKTSPERKKQLYDLYIKRHDRINNWDLVDRAAPYVVGSYLVDKDRKPLYKLAKSKNIWERRTAIVATAYFIRQGDIADTFKVGEMLVHDKHEMVNMAVGSWVRHAGQQDKQALLSFLDKFARTMPRVTFRYAIEKLEKKEKDKYI